MDYDNLTLEDILLEIEQEKTEADFDPEFNESFHAIRKWNSPKQIVAEALHTPSEWELVKRGKSID